MGGRCFAGGTESAVEQAHDTLDDRDVRRSRAVQQQRDNAVFADQERVEVAARPPGGQSVIAGVNEIGSHLLAGDRQVARGQRGHQSGCDGGLSVPGRRRGDDKAGKINGYHSIPRWPF
jgi:hypothetical protein